MLHVPCKSISKSVKETYDLAKKLAGRLQGGEVLCLIGDLGAGKTAFTKGLAAGLGITNTITSPTFVLMKVYEIKNHLPALLRKALQAGENEKIPTRIAIQSITGGKKQNLSLVHIDAYRLNNGEQLAEIGAADYFGQSDCITVIEWADRVKDIWPKKVIKIEFKILKGDKREIKITSI